jgi:hypothetical protein
MSALQRSFYEFAAEIAHQGVPRVQRKVIVQEEFLLRSNILETDYQDCLFAFSSPGLRLFSQSVHGLVLARALNKFCKIRSALDQDALLELDAKNLSRKLSQLYNDAALVLDWPKRSVIYMDEMFAPEEIMVLMLWVCRDIFSSILKKPSENLSALSFHNQLSKLVLESDRHPFLFISENTDGQDLSVLIDKASLFSANRLRKKSLQNSNGAEPLIRYYHAALKSSIRSDEQIDILYWLKLDEDHSVIAGDYIIDKQSDLQYCNISLLFPMSRLLEVKNGGVAIPAIIKEIVGLYIDSLFEPRSAASED